MTGKTENPAAMTERTMSYTLLSPYGRTCSQTGFRRALVPLMASVMAAQIMAKLMSIDVAKKESREPRRPSMVRWARLGLGAPSWDSSRRGRPRRLGSLAVKALRIEATEKAMR